MSNGREVTLLILGAVMGAALMAVAVSESNGEEESAVVSDSLLLVEAKKLRGELWTKRWMSIAEDSLWLYPCIIQGGYWIKSEDSWVWKVTRGETWKEYLERAEYWDSLAREILQNDFYIGKITWKEYLERNDAFFRGGGWDIKSEIEVTTEIMLDSIESVMGEVRTVKDIAEAMTEAVIDSLRYEIVGSAWIDTVEYWDSLARVFLRNASHNWEYYDSIRVENRILDTIVDDTVHFKFVSYSWERFDSVRVEDWVPDIVVVDTAYEVVKPWSWWEDLPLPEVMEWDSSFSRKSRRVRLGEGVFVESLVTETFYHLEEK